MLKSRGLRWGITAVLSLAVLLYLFYIITPGRVITMLNGASIRYFAVALLCYLAANGFKTLRFNYLIKDKKPSFVKMYYLNARYNFFTAMAAGLGELSYPLMLRKMFGISVGVGASSVVLTRIYDLLFLGMVFLLSVSTFISENRMKVVLIAAVGLCVIMLVIAYLADRLTILAAKLVYLFFGRTHCKIVGKVVAALNDMSCSLRRTKKISIHLRLFIYTAPVWILVFLVFFFLFLAFDIRLTLIETIFLGASVNLMGVLPVKVIGGLGFLEAGLAGLLLLLGFEKYQAVSLGLMVRLISFSYIFVLIIVAYVGHHIFAWRDSKVSSYL